MFKKIIEYSVRNKLVVFLFVGLIIIGGVYSMRGIPLDAVPDITNNQVQVVTISPALAAEEIEQLITFPIEASLSNLPKVVEIRSISRYGLSVITVVFEERLSILDARQYVKEQLSTVEIPPDLGTPELMPITTGLGEIYQYTLQVEPGYEGRYDIMDLRTIQDWIVKRQLAGISGVIEVSSFGGLVKQYEVAVDPAGLRSLDLTLQDVTQALRANNANSGGSYIEQGTDALYIRSFGRLENFSDIEKIPVAQREGVPVYIRDIAVVRLGSPNRYGAMTMDGKGEVVGGITLMLKGSSSSATIDHVKARIVEISSALPEGVKIEPYLDRSELIGRAINTVEKNLIEGGLIVIFILILLLGNWRGGLIVASVIPLSMLFAFTLMRQFGVSANLMSLGAIDFGIVVDGAVIIVEAVLHVLFTAYVGKELTQKKMDQVVIETSGKIYNSAAFGILIILVVFIPVMTLTGIEGKMFRPMAFTVSFAILGAMILSLTYVPVMATLLLNKKISTHRSISDRLVNRLRNAYEPSLRWALNHSVLVIASAMLLLGMSVFTFSRMGGEFIPTLEEGDLAMQMTIQPGSSLSESIRTSTKAEQVLIENFPEVRHVVSKIGTAEVPTDPMAIEDADIMIILKDKSEWVSAQNREELAALMKEKLSIILGAHFDFTQPIQLRFNELMTGAKTDIAIQIFGEDTEQLALLADHTSDLIADIPGVGDIKVEQTEGLPQLMITYERELLAYYGIHVDDLNSVIKSAYAGTTVGQIFENERQFDLVVRYQSGARNQFDLDRLWVRTMARDLIPVSQVASVTYRESPLQISREQAKRRINVGVNVRNRDVASLVADIQKTIQSQLRLPPGYIVKYGGQFENLERAKARLQFAVPLALVFILLLLYFTFRSITDSLIIFIAVPLSAIGGVFALWLRGMPFSISAGVGFIALFGVSVLNGIVLIQYYNQLREEGETSLTNVLVKGGLVRMRPVIMTASVAALGFLPMAISTTAGAEVQRPLATVVIGGLITSTLLTLIVLPVIYRWIHQSKKVMNKPLMLLILALGIGHMSQAQIGPTDLVTVQQKALKYHGSMDVSLLEIEKKEALKSQIYDPGNLNLSLAYGQINAGVNDYNFSLTQSLGNIPKAIASNRASNEAITLAKGNLELTRRWLKMEVTQTYLNWISDGWIMKSFNDQLDEFRQAITMSKKAIEAGDRSELEMTYLSQEFQVLKNRYFLAKVDYEKSMNRLIELTGISGDSLILPDSWPEMRVASDTVLSDVFMNLFDTKMDLHERLLHAERLGYFPSFNVGYFNQELEGITGFDGIQVGASIPLWFKPQSARVQVQKVALESAEKQNRLQYIALQQSLQRTLNTLELMSEDSNQSEFTEDQLKSTINQARSAVQNGQLDLFDYVKLVGQAYESVRASWQSKKIYLSTLTEFNYYTE